MTQSAEHGTFPANVDVERSLLGTLLLKGELWSDTAESLCPDDFSLDAHQRIFRAMVDLGREYGSFDAQTLAIGLERELPSIGGEAYLSDLECGAVVRSNIKPLCKVIREKSVLREVARRAEALQSGALCPGIRLEECQRQTVELLTVYEVAQSNRLRVCSMGEFLALDIPAREKVLDPILPTQGTAMLYSKRGVGKTYLALDV
jgi:replicative DNA helicase